MELALLNEQSDFWKAKSCSECGKREGERRGRGVKARDEWERGRERWDLDGDNDYRHGIESAVLQASGLASLSFFALIFLQIRSIIIFCPFSQAYLSPHIFHSHLVLGILDGFK